MKLIYVGGIHAVGKGTLVENVDIPGFKVVNYSEEMIKRSNKDSNNRLNLIPYEERLRIRDEIYKSLMLSTDDLILDSHHSVLVMRGEFPDRFEFGIPDYFLSYITSFVLIEAKSDVVLDRRKKDAQYRRVVDQKIIEMELLIEREFAELVSVKSERELSVIDNSGDLTKAIREFESIIKRI